MTFETRLAAQEDIAVQFYARVSGLPYIFSNLPIPTAWDAGSATVSIGGETYTWSTSLVLDRLSAISASVEPKRGIGITGSLQVEFQLTGTQADQSGDVWYDLANPSLHRSDRFYSTLTADLDIGTTASATVSTVTNWPSGSGTRNLYVGTETMSYATTTAGTGIGDATFATLSRGLFGSFDTFHVGGLESARETGHGGTHISSGPLVIEGRVIEIWMAGGVLKNQVFTPHASTPMTNEDLEIYKGVITGVKQNKSLNRLGMDTQTLDQLLARHVGSRMPRAKAARHTTGYFDNTIQIDSSCNQIPWKFLTYGSSGGDHIPTATRLQMDDGASGTINVPDGLYSTGQIGTYINHTINNATYNTAISSYDVTFQLRIDADNKHVINVDVTTSPSPYGEFFLFVNRNDTLWAQLGFELGSSQIAFIDGTSNTITLTADKKRAAFYWPANDLPRRLYYQGRTGPAFDEAPGWLDDAGNAVDGYVRIGESEIVSFDGKGTSIGGLGSGYLDCKARNTFGSLLEEDIYIEHNFEDDKQPDVVQLPAFPDTSTALVALYLLHCVSGTAQNNATYDLGWRGAGAGIDTSLIDVASFTSFNDERQDQKGRYHAIREPIELREWIKHELIIGQAFMGADSNFTSGHKIRLDSIEPANEDAIGASTTRLLTHNTIASTGGAGITFDASAQRLINALRIKTNYDHAAGKYWDTYDQSNATSKGTFGEQEPLDIELQGLKGSTRNGTHAEQVQRVTEQIWLAYAWPYVVVSFVVNTFQAWTWRIGDPVAITHTALPSLNSVGRGWTSVLGRIYKISKNYRKDNERAIVTCIVRRWQGRRYGTWSPSAYLASKTSDTIWTATANKYTDSSEDDDATHFEAGDKVRLYTPGTNTSTIATIESVVGNTITFTGVGVVGAAPLIMTSVEHDDSGITASQKRHAFIASWDPPASLAVSGGTTDAAYYYQ